MTDLEKQYLVNLEKAGLGRNLLAAARADIRLDVKGYNERILTPPSSAQDIPKRTINEPKFGPCKHHTVYSNGKSNKAGACSDTQLWVEEAITKAPLARLAVLANLYKTLEDQYLSSLDNLDKERLELEEMNGLTTARREFRLCLIDLRRSQESLKHVLWLNYASHTFTKHGKSQRGASNLKTIKEAQVEVFRAVHLVKEAERVLCEHGEVPGRWLRPIGPERWVEMGASENRSSGDDPAIRHMEEAGQKIQEDGEVPERWRIPSESSCWTEAEDNKTMPAKVDSSGTSEPIWRTRTGISKLLQEMYDEEAYRSSSERESAQWSEEPGQEIEHSPWLACETETETETPTASSVIDTNAEESSETNGEMDEADLRIGDEDDYSAEDNYTFANEAMTSIWPTCEYRENDKESPNMLGAYKRAWKFQRDVKTGTIAQIQLCE